MFYNTELYFHLEHSSSTLDFGNVFIHSILIIEIINKIDLCSFESLQKSVISPNIWSVCLPKSKMSS